MKFLVGKSLELLVEYLGIRAEEALVVMGWGAAPRLIVGERIDGPRCGDLPTELMHFIAELAR
ncbi:hypothetical protein DZK27_16485 [Rhodobacteraceae bacterium 63075]|nr:hypothetical protein DZK27_16485 [Rhodobacteraceae bacterium 63075]